jgi:hypothetical protein
MTLITWNGGPIFRDGAVSTEQACCCDTPPPPPPPCDPCEGCEFPTGVLDNTVEPGGLNCQAFVPWYSNVRQSLYTGPTLPDGVAWKDGYPEALFGVEWRLVSDFAIVSDCYMCGDTNENNGSELQGLRQRYRYRIMVLCCPNGDESAQITDITADALEGDLEGELNFPPVPQDGCSTERFASTDWLDFFPDPEPVCNEFP